MNKNINTLIKLNQYDSLIIENNTFIKKDKRYLKCYRPAYECVDDIIQIIKSIFNNELLLIQLNKINNINNDNRISRLHKAYNGVLNLLYYYNNYTEYGEKLTELIKYLDNKISNIDNIPTNLLKYEKTIIDESDEKNDEYDTTDEFNTDDESDNESDNESDDESDDEIKQSIYENLKNSIYIGSNNIKNIVVQAITSFINAVKSIFSFF